MYLVVSVYTVHSREAGVGKKSVCNRAATLQYILIQFIVTSPCAVRCVKWPYAVVREIHKRRYLLQHCALEMFSSDGRNQFLIFHTNKRDKLYHK